MENKSSITKKIIVILTLVVILVGIFFGLKFYKESQDPEAVAKRNNGAIPFQTRTTPGGDVVVTEPLLNTNTSSTPSDTTPSSSEPSVPRLIQLSKEPVSGFDFVTKDIEIYTFATPTQATTTTRSIDEKKTTAQIASTTQKKVTEPLPKKTVIKNQQFVYFWDRKSGNIFENLASTSETVRISNYTLPGMEQAYFGDATSAFVRKVSNDNETIESTYISLTKPVGTSTIYTVSEKNININTKQVSFAPDVKKLFYFGEKTGRGFTMNIDGTSPVTILTTSLTEWLYQYINKNTVVVTTKPSAFFPGYMFFVNTNGSQNNTYILGERYGFTTLVSPDGKKVLYSQILGDDLQTYIYDVATKKETFLTQSTLPEKCVWTTNSATIYCAIPKEILRAPYPDAWYQGIITFEDNIWSIDAKTGVFTPIANLETRIPGLSVDIQTLKISKDSKYLLFQDKNTLGLWKFRL